MSVRVKYARTCPYLPTILKFQEILTEKIEGKVYVNQDDDVFDLQHTLFCVFSMNYYFKNGYVVNSAGC